MRWHSAQGTINRRETRRDDVLSPVTAPHLKMPKTLCESPRCAPRLVGPGLAPWHQIIYWIQFQLRDETSQTVRLPNRGVKVVPWNLLASFAYGQLFVACFRGPLLEFKSRKGLTD